jgi:hypothetical protein
LAIQDLIYRHSDATTKADWQQLRALYAPDAVWEIPALGLRYDGVAALMEMLEPTSTIEMIIQTPHASVINLIDSDQAHATTTIHEWIRGVTQIDSAAIDVQKGEETNQEFYGIYYDDVARMEGEWKFTHRVYVPIYAATGCVTGTVLTPRSDLLRAT